MEFTSALAFQGVVGWWEESFAGMFDGETGTIATGARDGLTLSVSSEGLDHVAAFTARADGWMEGTWRAKDGDRGRVDSRRYLDGAGALWFCEWFSAQGPSLLWLDARGPVGARGRVEGRTAWISGGRQQRFPAEASRAVLRESAAGEELVMSVDIEGSACEVRLRREPDGAWRGEWIFDRGANRGPLRGRVLRDSQDLFVIAEWVRGAEPFTFLAVLTFQRRVI